jgi:hypothetical protein
VIYLDLHQEETGGRSQTSPMMQVLFNIVYERAKQTDKRVVFVIDEAHYLVGDAPSLEFLETAVRHSRHYDPSLQSITRTGGEFALTPEARTIANLCSMRLIHLIAEGTSTLTSMVTRRRCRYQVVRRPTGDLATVPSERRHL